MIQEFVDRFNENRNMLKANFKKKHPEDYKEIVKSAIQLLKSDDGYSFPDPDIIHEIDDGNCQGTLLYIIPEHAYNPSEYWYVKISYGSCSSCDTLESIKKYSDHPPTDEQVKDYIMLALHIVQGLKKMSEDIV